MRLFLAAQGPLYLGLLSRPDYQAVYPSAPISRTISPQTPMKFERSIEVRSTEGMKLFIAPRMRAEAMLASGMARPEPKRRGRIHAIRLTRCAQSFQSPGPLTSRPASRRKIGTRCIGLTVEILQPGKCGCSNKAECAICQGSGVSTEVIPTLSYVMPMVDSRDQWAYREVLASVGAVLETR